ncbi:hypothetical protein, partial [Salmonella enterica]|uniref:hypothetical protein n=1 Tax=Salmonella enterica TaxID=28901 RepID=UPI002FCDC4AF
TRHQRAADSVICFLAGRLLAVGPALMAFVLLTLLSATRHQRAADSVICFLAGRLLAVGPALMAFVLLTL